MQPPPAEGLQGLPHRLPRSRREAIGFIQTVWARDPVRAWELWLQFTTKERLEDILVVLLVIGSVLIFVGYEIIAAVRGF